MGLCQNESLVQPLYNNALFTNYYHAVNQTFITSTKTYRCF